MMMDKRDLKKKKEAKESRRSERKERIGVGKVYNFYSVHQ
jgi:hypothetical protein